MSNFKNYLDHILDCYEDQAAVITSQGERLFIGIRDEDFSWNKSNLADFIGATTTSLRMWRNGTITPDLESKDHNLKVFLNIPEAYIPYLKERIDKKSTPYIPPKKLMESQVLKPRLILKNNPLFQFGQYLPDKFFEKLYIVTLNGGKDNWEESFEDEIKRVVLKDDIHNTPQLEVIKKTLLLNSLWKTLINTYDSANSQWGISIGELPHTINQILNFSNELILTPQRNPIPNYGVGKIRDIANTITEREEVIDKDIINDFCNDLILFLYRIDELLKIWWGDNFKPFTKWLRRDDNWRDRIYREFIRSFNFPTSIPEDDILNGLDELIDNGFIEKFYKTATRITKNNKDSFDWSKNGTEILSFLLSHAFGINNVKLINHSINAKIRVKKDTPKDSKTVQSISLGKDENALVHFFALFTFGLTSSEKNDFTEKRYIDQRVYIGNDTIQKLKSHMLKHENRDIENLSLEVEKIVQSFIRKNS